jgi:hypothetical protein
MITGVECRCTERTGDDRDHSLRKDRPGTTQRLDPCNPRVRGPIVDPGVISRIPAQSLGRA